MMADSILKLPEDFSARMKHQLNDSFSDFQESLQSKSSISIRLNSPKGFEIEGAAIPWCNSGKYLKERPVFTLDPAFHAGGYYVQEASSMFLEQVFLQLNLTSKPIRVLDLCAAPGGKSTHIISMIHRESLLVSNEVIRSRASILVENMTKWGFDNYLVSNNDPKDFKSMPGFFDVVVVDAPCSGEGLFRKDPQAMNEWSVENTNHCAIRQRRIVSDIWPSIKSGGLLIYCTCTYNPSENEENIQWLQGQHDIESIKLDIENEWGIEEVQYNGINGYRFYPHRVKGEGFFLTVLRKTESQKETLVKLKRKSNLPNTIINQLNEWVINPEASAFQSHIDGVYMVKKELSEVTGFLKHHLNVVSIGTPVATLKGSKLIPDHALALSINLNKENFVSKELLLEEALIYLKKDTVILDEYKKGFLLVNYKSLPLGWLNVLDNRSNNLYPKEWRIRMKVS